MRFNIRLIGTANGKACQADITVYARGSKDLVKQAQHVSETADWCYTESPHDPVPDGSLITVEHVERLKGTG